MNRTREIIQQELRIAKEYCSSVGRLELELAAVQTTPGYIEKIYPPSQGGIIFPQVGQGIEGWEYRGPAVCELEAKNLGTRVFRMDWNPLTHGPDHVRSVTAWCSRNGFQLDIRVGYHNPKNNDGDKNPDGSWKILEDQPVIRVKADIDALATIMNEFPWVFGYIQFNPWGFWGEGHTSTMSDNQGYWIEVVGYGRSKFPSHIYILCRFPGIIRALHANPSDAAKMKYGVCNLGWGHASGENEGANTYKKNFPSAQLAKDYQRRLVGSPFHFEVMQASWYGGPLGPNHDTKAEIESQLAFDRASTYNPDGPGRDAFRAAGGFSVLHKLGAQLDLVSVKIPEKVKPGEEHKVWFTLKNNGLGFVYHDFSPCLNVEINSKALWSETRGINLSEIEPGSTRTFEATWKVNPQMPKGVAQAHLTVYHRRKIPDNHANRSRYQWKFNNAPAFGTGDGGNNLGINVQVM